MSSDAADGCLLAILLFTSSSKGSHIAFRWPARSTASPRLARPLPLQPVPLDFNWRASHPLNGASPDQELLDAAVTGIEESLPAQCHPNDDPVVGQQVTNGTRSRAASLSTTTPTTPHPNSYEQVDADARWYQDHDYKYILGYPISILAGKLFRFERKICNQRFELVIEELMFLGHPVCIGEDGTWGWKELYADPSPDGETNQDSVSEQQPKDDSKERAFKAFHLILVLDRPDPSVGGDVNIGQFVDVYYKQIAQRLTAALHYEQARDGYVEKQADLLVDLCYETMKSEPYKEFEVRALKESSLARAIRDVFVAVQNKRIAHLKLGEFELDVQLPWHHSQLLYGDNDPEGVGEYGIEDERDDRWDGVFGREWRVPRLDPWKTLLFLDPPAANMEGSVILEPDREEPESEEMLRFREVLTPDVSFADAAALLDWDLEAEVIPFARFMIYLKKAKVSSVVHPKLLGIYAPPVTLATPLNALAKHFESTFPPTTPSFYTIFAAVSSCQQAFSYFVPSLDHMPLWREILLFFLKNDALVMLHLHFRIIVTGDIKQSVYAAHQRKIEARKFRAALRHGIEDRGRKRALPNWTRAQTGSPLYEEELMPVPQQVSGREVLRKSEVESAARKEHEYSSPKFTYKRGARGIAWSEDEPRRSSDDEPTDVEGLQESEEEDVEPDIEIPEDMTMSFINKPREVTGIERLWLEEIAQQRPALKDEFLDLSGYFDGRTTFEEIQYKTEIKRARFRNLIIEYDTWLLSMLHA